MTECSIDGCAREVHNRGPITFDVCTEHYLDKMSSLRPEGEHEPV